MGTFAKKGFTLIEIIIVIVIIGVLATLALPKITGQLESAKAGEAMAMLGTIKRMADQCYEATSSMGSCDTFSELGISNPGASALFTYQSAVSSGKLRVEAARTAVGSSLGYICMEFDPSTAVASQTIFGAPAGSPYKAIVVKTGATGIADASCGGSWGTSSM